MFLEIHTDRRRQTPYVYGLFRETFRQDGQVRHRTRGRVTHLSLSQLQGLRDFVQRGCPQEPGASCTVKNSREYGATWAVLRMAKSLGVDKLLLQACERGTVLSGLSAGAICWFRYDSFQHWICRARGCIISVFHLCGSINTFLSGYIVTWDCTGRRLLQRVRLPANIGI
jgi:hypothetical protein